MADVVLDAGALIAVERGSTRVIALLERLVDSGGRFVVPAGALAQAWRGGARQARLAKLLTDHRTVVDALDARLARSAGEVCGAAGTSDVVDASVVLAARARRAPVLTSDPDDLRHLDPRAAIFTV